MILLGLPVAHADVLHREYLGLDALLVSDLRGQHVQGRRVVQQAVDLGAAEALAEQREQREELGAPSHPLVVVALEELVDRLPGRVLAHAPEERRKGVHRGEPVLGGLGKLFVGS